MSTEVPPVKSVGELRQWLKNFGEGNRQHFEHNQVTSKPFNVSRHVEKFEQLSRVDSFASGKSTGSGATTSSIHHQSRRGALSNMSTTTKIPFIHRANSLADFEDDNQKSGGLASRRPKVPEGHGPNFQIQNSKVSSLRHPSNLPSMTVTSSENSKESEKPKSILLLPDLPDCYDDMSGSFEGEHKTVTTSRTITVTRSPVRSPLPSTEDQLESHFRIISIDQTVSSSSSLQLQPPHIRRQWDNLPWARNARDDEDGSIDEENQDAWTTTEEQDTFDESSIATGRYTDPGRFLRYPTLAPMTKPYFGGSSFRQKLPMLLCKSAKDTDDNSNSSLLTLHDLAAASNAATTAPETMAKHAIFPVPSRPCLDNPAASPTSMYNGTVFPNNTLTSEHWDLIYRANDSAKMQTHRDSMNSKNSAGREEDATVSTWSEDSGMPSISPNAIDDNLNSIFGEETNQMNKEAMAKTMNTLGARPRSSVRGSPPKQQFPGASRSSASQISPRVPSLQSSSVGSSSLDSLSPNRGRVLEAANQFGGSRRSAVPYRPAAKQGMTAVERKKLELERKWAAERQPTHVRKVKWQVGHASGMYKKKVVLDFTD